MLSDGYEVANTPYYQDNHTHLEDEIEVIEEEIEFFEGDKIFDDFLNCKNLC